jgi:hypothetical protein
LNLMLLLGILSLALTLSLCVIRRKDAKDKKGGTLRSTRPTLKTGDRASSDNPQLSTFGGRRSTFYDPFPSIEKTMAEHERKQREPKKRRWGNEF